MHLRSRRCSFAEQMKRTRNGVSEEVSNVSFPSAPPRAKMKCPHCPRTFVTTQGRGLRCKTAHPCPDRYMGLRRALATSGTTTTPPWRGMGGGRCLIVRFHHKTIGVGDTCHVAGKITFKLQPGLTGNAADDIADDEFGTEPGTGLGARRAAKRCRYANRQKAGTIAELRELAERRAEVWGVHRMAPQYHLERDWNIKQSHQQAGTMRGYDCQGHRRK